MSRLSKPLSNLELLTRFWNRRPFHDSEILEVTATNKRVIIRLKDYSLIITAATNLKRCKLPVLWLYETLEESLDGFVLNVEVEGGADDRILKVAGKDVRLIRNSDLAVLIPEVDA